MDNKDLGRRSGLFLAVFLIIAFTRILKHSFINIKHESNTKIERLILDNLPVVIATCSWLIILLGYEYYPIDLVACGYKILAVLSYSFYIFKRISNESPYDYSKFQHQMILLDYIYYFGFRISVNSCKSVNRIVKFHIVVILVYLAVNLTRIGCCLYLYSKKSDLGTWEMNFWGVIRGLEVLFLLILMIGSFSFHHSLKPPEKDYYYFYLLFQLFAHQFEFFCLRVNNTLFTKNSSRSDKLRI